jgi:hypothetical protein
VDEFWTESENAFRARAAGLVRHLHEADAGDLAAALQELGLSADASLSGRVSLVDEASRRDPRLGDRALEAMASSIAPDPAARAACILGRLAGTAAYVFEAGARAAKERGFFSSILMDFREVQERLALLVTGADLARFGACRLCRLLERGERDRAAREAAGLLARAAAFDAEVRSVAAFLLGPERAGTLAPLENIPSADERTIR